MKSKIPYNYELIFGLFQVQKRTTVSKLKATYSGQCPLFFLVKTPTASSEQTVYIETHLMVILQLINILCNLLDVYFWL
jgi:hypothetical protein